MINKILGVIVGSVSLCGEGEKRGEERGGREGEREGREEGDCSQNITSQWYKRLYNLAKQSNISNVF